MKGIVVCVVLCGMGFSQVLMVDSILDPGAWVNPDSIFASDNMFGSPGANNDELLLQVEDPTDTSGTIDSVIVFLEQYVSDASKGGWYIRPYFLGVPGTSTPEQMGSETESVLMFNITTDITGWSDIYDLEIGVRNVKVGGGANPDWYADYVYVGVFPGLGVNEYGNLSRHLEMLMPTIVRSKVCFTVTQMTSTDLYADIYDVSGKKVYNAILDGRVGTFTYSINDLDFLARGVYYLMVHDLQNMHVRTGKFIMMD